MVSVRKKDIFIECVAHDEETTEVNKNSVPNLH